MTNWHWFCSETTTHTCDIVSNKQKKNYLCCIQMYFRGFQQWNVMFTFKKWYHWMWIECCVETSKMCFVINLNNKNSKKKKKFKWLATLVSNANQLHVKRDIAVFSQHFTKTKQHTIRSSTKPQSKFANLQRNPIGNRVHLFVHLVLKIV